MNRLYRVKIETEVWVWAPDIAEANIVARNEVDLFDATFAEAAEDLAARHPNFDRFIDSEELNSIPWGRDSEDRTVRQLIDELKAKITPNAPLPK